MGFDGSNDYVNCGDPADESLDFGTGDFTLECWVKTTTVNNRSIMTKMSNFLFDDRGYAIGIGTGKVNATLDIGTPAFEIGLGSATINDDTWHHIVVVFDRDNQCTYYVDGDVDKQTDIWEYDGESTSSDHNFELSRRQVALGKYAYLDGSIDEARVSNSIRSVAWINTSYLNQNSPSTFLNTGSQTTIYLTITVENTGNVNLKTSDFNILINGTKYQCTCDHPCLYPLNEVHFFLVTQIASGAKQIKVISEKGTEDNYEYTG
jgi:archaellum component FlaF (FlaF/FlaG flagellin family)